jgi:RHS repeat-associated protein
MSKYITNSATDSIKRLKGSRYLLLIPAFIIGIVLASIYLGEPNSNPVVERKVVPKEEITKYVNKGKNTAKTLGESGVVTNDQQANNQNSNNTNGTNGNSNAPASNNNSGNVNNPSPQKPPTQKLTVEDFKNFISGLLIEQIEEKGGKDAFAAELKNKIVNNKYDERFSQAIITPSEGGILKAGNIEINFPAGSVTEPLIATFQTKSIATIELTDNILNKPYSLTAITLDGKEVTTFAQNLTITSKLATNDLQVANLAATATYYKNEINNNWEKINSEFKDNTIVATTNHFSTYITLAEEPVDGEDPVEDEYLYEDCTTFVDDSYIVDEDPEDEIDRTECFDFLGVWELQQVGALKTSLYSNDFWAQAYYYPDYKNLDGEKELFATIPDVPALRDAEYELNPVAVYYVFSQEGVERIKVEINQEEEKGSLVSLGKFDFNGTDAVVNFYGFEDVNEENIYQVTDAICFGECPEGLGDLTPPLIEDVITYPFQGKIYIEAKVTDSGSGVGNVYFSFNGEIWLMNKGANDRYSVVVPYQPGINIDYYIIAYDNSGNEAIWNPLRGYVSRGSGLNIGIPPEARNFLRYKQSYFEMSAAKAGCETCPPTQMAGDPVNTQNGNLMEQVQLVRISGNPDIQFNINYNSQGGGLTIFGQSWRHDYSYHLTKFDNADFNGVFLEYPTGFTARFTGSDLTPEVGNFDELEKVGDGYVLTKKDKSKVYFDTFGDVIRIEDRNFNGINFEYSEQFKYINFSKLAKIKSDDGKEITFEYGASNGDLVTKISFEGRTINIEYNDSDDITKITEASGDVHQFEYSDHNITKRISPKGHVLYENTYDSNRRVIKQIAGDDFVQSFEYHDDYTTVTDGKGTVAQYEFSNDSAALTQLVDEKGGQYSFEYDLDKNIIARRDANGNEFSYDYDDNGNATEIIDPKGNKVLRTFNDLNKVTSQTDPEGNETKYSYDSRGNVTKITNSQGKAGRFVYDNNGNLTEETDFKGNKTRYEYDSFGSVIKTTDALGYSTKYEYDAFGKRTKEVKANGNTYNYIYDANDQLTEINGPLGYKVKYSYDSNGHMLSETDANGNITTYEYDLSENLTKQINPLGASLAYQYGQMNEKLNDINELGTVTAYEYTSNYRVSNTRNAAGTSKEALTHTEYAANNLVKSITDAEGRIILFEYDSLGRKIKEIKDSTGVAAITEYVYDETGALVKQINPNGGVTTFEVDDLDRVIKETDAAGNITSYEYDDNGNVTKVTNARGFETKFEYDALNRTKKEINPKAGTKSYEYDSVGNKFQEKDENGKVTTYKFDELERLVKKVDNFKLGCNSTDCNLATIYEYDLNGNITKLTNPRGFATTFAYDADNRNTSITDAKGNTTYLEYDAADNLLRIKDKNGNMTSKQYDELNRVVTEINAENLASHYSYDKVGNLKVKVDARGNATQFNYDGLNRLVNQIDAIGNVQNYSYDKIGNRLTATDENSHTTTYSYDILNRLTQSINPEGHSESFNYDQNGNRIKTTDARGNSTSYNYDELDRLVEQINAEGNSYKYAHDAVGNILTETDENSHVTNYQFDGIYRITSVTDAEGNITKLDYDQNGNNIQITDGNGHKTIQIFDELDRLVEEKNAEGEVKKYQYDNEGNKVAQIDPDGVITNYNLDKIYRLIAVVQDANNANVKTDYKYDPNNNLTEIVNANGYSTLFEYDPLNRQIKEVDAEGNIWNFDYDGVGNKISRHDANGKTTNYAYYPDNQLAEINYNGNQSDVSYQYDQNNNRVAMSDGLGSSAWAYDSLNRVTNATDSLGRTLGFGYDNVGNRTSITYPDSRVINYGYYKNNWLENMVDSDGGAVSYERDGVGNNLKSTNPNNTLTETNYDKVNRILSINNKKIDGSVINSSFNYNYDDVGSRTSVTATYNWRQPGTVTTDYTYDSLRRLVKSTDSEGIFSEYTYDNVGNRLAYKTNDQGGTNKPFDELDQMFTYNKINQITSIVEDGKSTGGNKNSNNDNASQAIYALKHELEAQSGKQISEVDANNVLDQLEILIAELESNNSDPVIVNIQVELISSTINQLQVSDGIKNSLLVKLDKGTKAFNGTTGDLETTLFEYDDNGNRIEMRLPGKGNGNKNLINYNYDIDDRLIEYIGEKNNEQVDLAYDGLGRRLVKEEKANKRSEFVYDNLDPIVQYDIWNNHYDNYYRGDRNNISMVQNFPSGTDGQKYWYYYDAVDSVVGLSKQDGQSNHNYRYGDFGSIEPDNGNFTEPHNSFTYTGQLLDETMGVYEFYSRSYDPVVGVWLQQDRYRGVPVDPMSLHRYMYVNDSPVSYKDAYGYTISDTCQSYVMEGGGVSDTCQSYVVVNTPPYLTVDDLKLGDILLFAVEPDNLKSSAMNAASGFGGYKHAAMYMGDGKIAEYPGQDDTFKINNLASSYWDYPANIDVFRYQSGGLTTEQMDKIKEYNKGEENAEYGTGSAILAGTGVDFFTAVIGPIGWIANYATPKRSCADYIDAAYAHAGIDLTDFWKGNHVSPNDLYYSLKDKKVGTLKLSKPDESTKFAGVAGAGGGGGTSGSW